MKNAILFSIFIAIVASTVVGCQSFSRGYFRVNQREGGGNTNWAATSHEVGKLLNK